MNTATHALVFISARVYLSTCDPWGSLSSSLYKVHTYHDERGLL